ncbi:MAG TPA: hypothetical protein VJU16_03245 [Planctomycetota bacterium]|nr:hypothetical protein [Planctomycetota bacterium]
MIAATLILMFAPFQDAWEKATKDLFPIDSVRARGRLDLRLGPSLDSGRCTILPAKVSADLAIMPDFACGRFDVAASFKSTFTKSFREELLGSLISSARVEIAGSAMVLACQMSPTLCDAMKHYKIVAGESLALQFGQCRSVESGASGIADGMRARAIKQCLAELQAGGFTLDEAMHRCQSSRHLRGLLGGRVEEINLVKEVTTALKLPRDAESLLLDVLGDMAYREKGRNGAVHIRPVAGLFEKLRLEFEVSWSKAASDPTRAGNEKLVPAGAPPATPFEVQRIAHLPEGERRIVISSLASSLSLQETSRRLGEAQAALESAASLASDPALERKLTDESRRLDVEFRRLREEYEMSEIVARARLRLDGEARGIEARGIRQATEPWRREAANEAASRASAPWGSGCPVERKP